jgi:poly-gamma-glutamate synthesis protein (capsule biosynthesis protein)
MNPTPPAHHLAIARSLVAAGADLLAGHSAHVFQGVDVVNESIVCYDLGDLLDDYRVDPVLRNDLGVLALLRPGERLELVPLKLDFARTGLATDADHAWIVDRMQRASTGIALEVDRGRLVINLAREGGFSPRRGARARSASG